MTSSVRPKPGDPRFYSLSARVDQVLALTQEILEKRHGREDIDKALKDLALDIRMILR